MDQLETGQLSFRKNFLDEKNLERVKNLYGIKNGANKKHSSRQ